MNVHHQQKKLLDEVLSCSVFAGAGAAARVGGFENLTRIRAVKTKYDPTNLFRNHHFTGLVQDADKADRAL